MTVKNLKKWTKRGMKQKAVMMNKKKRMSRISRREVMTPGLYSPQNSS